MTFDNVSAGTTGGSSFAQSFAVTGPNPIFLMIVQTNTGEDTRVQTPTYNGVAVTEVGRLAITPENQQAYIAYLLMAPATGTNTIAVTYSPALSVYGNIVVVSYRGASQVNQPDSYGQFNQNSGPIAVTATTTVVNSNCWLVGFATDGITGAGAGTTHRGGAGTTYAGDSNGTVPTGSQSLQWSTTGITANAAIVIAIKGISSGGLFALI